MKTTLNKIRQSAPCRTGWKKLLASLNKTQADDEEISLLHILESNGLDDALWCLRAVEGYDKEKRLMACDFAESVLHIFESGVPNDDRPRKAICAARKFANGEITSEEMRVAAYDAADADAAYDASYAAYAAYDAAAYCADAAYAATASVYTDGRRQTKRAELTAIFKKYVN